MKRTPQICLGSPAFPLLSLHYWYASYTKKKHTQRCGFWDTLPPKVGWFTHKFFDYITGWLHCLQLVYLFWPFGRWVSTSSAFFLETLEENIIKFLELITFLRVYNIFSIFKNPISLMYEWVLDKTEKCCASMTEASHNNCIIRIVRRGQVLSPSPSFSFEPNLQNLALPRFPQIEHIFPRALGRHIASSQTRCLGLSSDSRGDTPPG